MTSPEQPPKTNDKELNFRALEAKFQERLREVEAEKEMMRQQLEARSRQQEPEEEDNSEPYVDHKKLNKTLARQNNQTQSEIARAMERVRQETKEEIRRDLWIEQNSDFDDVLKHENIEKFANENPDLAKTFLQMPDSFERKKLLYQTIKTVDTRSEQRKQSAIQEKIDSNRRTPYYQPSGIGASPYSSQSDFSPTGQKEAYNKMLELKKRLKLG